MFFLIPRCWDSHAHLMYTGMEKYALNLGSISDPSNLKYLKVETHHFRGKWLVGFGWDQFFFKKQTMPTRQELDLAFPDFPVFFTRKDGHAAWVNTRAFEVVGDLPPTIEGGDVYREASGEPTGILLDRAMTLFEEKIPPYSLSSEKIFIEEGLKIFNRAGFTHLRDMGGTESQWCILEELDAQKKLNLYVEQNFFFNSMKEFDHAIQAAERCRASSRAQDSHLRFAGLKFFLDGALGSEGAWLSQEYPGSGTKGLSLWSSEQLEEILRRAWKKGFALAVHALGDAAIEQIAQVASKLYLMGIVGELNIEHAEVARLESIEKLAYLKARVHMQPCHFLGDRLFLKPKLDSLYSYAFPWRALENSGIKISWGSDAPIEKPSVKNNLLALKEAQLEGIQNIQSKPEAGHSHPDLSWGCDCYTRFDFEKSEDPIEVIFDGKPLCLDFSKT